MTGTEGSCARCPICGGNGRLSHGDLVDKLYGAGGRWRLLSCAAADCGLLWLDPAPGPEELSAAYRGYHTHTSRSETSAVPFRRILRWLKHGYYARRYGYYPGGTSRWQRGLSPILHLIPGVAANLDFAVFRLPWRKDGRLLEVGCGAGAALRRLAELGWSVTGLDFDAQAVAVAARETALPIEQGDLLARGYPAASFDAVVSSHLLEHVPDPQAFLAECRRVLRPGGVTVHLTPNAAGWGYRLFGRDWRGLEPPRHLHVFTRPALDRLAATAGFADRDCRTTGRGDEILRQSLLLRHPGLGKSRLGLVFGAVVARAIGSAARLSWPLDPLAAEELVLTARRPQVNGEPLG